MISITCPHCSRVGKLKNAVPVGAKVRCPGCREPFTVQADAIDEQAEVIDLGIDLVGGQALDRGVALDEIVAEPEVKEPTTAAPPIPTPTTATVQVGITPSAPPIPPEPWYYRWIDGFANNLWTASVWITVILGFCFWAPFVAVVVLAIDPSSTTALVLISATFASEFVSVVSLFVTSTLLMLAVDHARNGRATRYHLEEMANQWRQTLTTPPAQL